MNWNDKQSLWFFQLLLYTPVQHTQSISALKNPILTCRGVLCKNALVWPNVRELGVSCRADEAVSHTQLRTRIAHVRGSASDSAKATSVRGLRASITLHLPVFLQKNGVIADQKTGLLRYPVNIHTQTICSEQSRGGITRSKQHYAVCKRAGN